MDPATPALAFAHALLDELARGGVRDVCVSPGSRSTPLMLALHRHPDLRPWVHLDERAAGFFALGLARASRRPVALVCTSGTAAANYLPAVVEASLSRAPLVVLTADRPPELRDWGAPQTIDQTALFGGHVRWFAEAPVPAADAALLRHGRALAARAVAVAAGRTPGPVHLNLPFREPLAPAPAADGADPWTEARALAPGRADGAPWTREHRPEARPDAEALALGVAWAREHARGAVACGPIDHPDLGLAVVRLASAAGWPVLAEPTSQLRRGAHRAEPGGDGVLAHADLVLGDAAFAAAHAPELVLRVGAPPTSKAFARWIDAHPSARIAVLDEADGWRDPAHRADHVLRVDPAAFCDAVARRLDDAAPRRGAWWRDFLRADAAAARAVDSAAEADGLAAPAVVRTLGEALPDGALLGVANSMAVRDLDAYLPASERALRVLSSRGANGIDGTLSTALGAAAAGAGPTALLTGDLAFLHDASGLVAARQLGRMGVPLVAVVMNDDGGGIFSLLPVARLGAAAGFDALFRAPHGQDLGALCRGAGLAHQRVTSREHLRAALKEAFGRPEPSVVEVPVDPARARTRHAAVRAGVAAALREAGL